MITRHDSPIVQVVCSVLIPFIQLYAIYVIMHGHYGPGGGFQGGVLLAVSALLMRLYLGKDIAHRKFPPKLAMALAAVGMLIYVLGGFVPVAMGGDFLDYSYLPLPWLHGPYLRYYGILIVEIGVALAVFGTMVVIFDNLIPERS